MSAVIAQVNISNVASRQKPITESVIVGKDILELLAGSMYVDPLNVYREYIQNAADSIDEARDQGLFFEETPGINISFDHIERVVRIRDNGTSIPINEFVQRLVTIGASQKRGKKLRGFRGVGRLSGLGYCQELIFRGRTDSASKVIEIRWDGRLLREKMRDPNYNGNLADLVQEVVTENLLLGDDFPNRFFEVELRKISRLRNDLLLNEDAVRGYISQVAPVPFDTNFSFGEEINYELELRGIRAPIRIELNDGRGPIVHRVQDTIKLSDTVADQIRSVEYVEFFGTDGDLCAFGWIADHSYAGSISKKHGVGGIRLRTGNIQVGDESILSSLFPESRFAGWSIGDIHILSPKILPNGRRDEFEPTNSYSHLQGELSLKAKLITQRIRERSVQRNQLSLVQQHLGVVDIWLKFANENYLPVMILNILHDLSRERLNKVAKEAARLAHDLHASAVTMTRLQELNVRVNELPALGNKESHNEVSNKLFEKPIIAALKTIISSAKTPDAGISLSLEVLAAIEMVS